MFLKSLINFIALLLGIRSEFTDIYVDDNIINYEGEGRDKYGK